MILTEDDKNFIIENIPNANKVLNSSKVKDVLDAIGIYIDDKGFAPPDYYDYNDLGREAQKVDDRIYKNNI